VVPNSTPATAIPILLPWTLTIDVSDTNIPTSGAWYRFTTGASVYLLSAHVSPLPPVIPSISFYDADGTTRVTPPATWLAATDGEPTNQPVSPETVYYARIDNGTSTPDSLVTFTVLANPVIAAPVGTLICPTDAKGFPALALAADGTLLRAAPFATGENGAALDNGVILADTRNTVGGNVDGTLELRTTDAAFSLIATLTDPLSTGTQYAIACAVGAAQFWIASPRSSSLAWTFTTVSYTGVVGGTIYSPSIHALSDIAISNDQKTLYYTPATGAGNVIATFDIDGNTDGPNFAAGVTGFQARDLVVLSDGRLIVEYFKQTDRTLDFIRLYATDGSTVRDITLTDVSAGTGFLSDHLARNGASAGDFWWWVQANLSTPPQNKYLRVRLSDAAVLNSFTLDQYNAGYGYAGTVDPFGSAASCPFLTLTQSIAGVTPTPPVVGPVSSFVIRRVRRAPHLWDGTSSHRMFYPGAELLFETGAIRDDVANPLYFGLQWSDDGGNTWSSVHWSQAQMIGQYKGRVRWQRLGYARDRVFQVVCASRVKVVLLDLILNPDPVQGAG
jgi:hypothetical protein